MANKTPKNSSCRPWYSQLLMQFRYFYVLGRHLFHLFLFGINITRSPFSAVGAITTGIKDMYDICMRVATTSLMLVECNQSPYTSNGFKLLNNLT